MFGKKITLRKKIPQFHGLGGWRYSEWIVSKSWFSLFEVRLLEDGWKVK